LSKILKTTPDYLMGWEQDDKLGTALAKFITTKDDELINMLIDLANMSESELNKFKTAYKIIKSNI
jgi:hypothetical protein